MKACFASLLLAASMLTGAFTISSVAFGRDDSGAVDVDSSADGSLPTINENWYMLWGLGLAHLTYNSEMQSAVDTLEDMPGIETFSGTYDLFGFYWPLADHKTMLGFVVNGSSQSWENKNARLRISHETYSFSAHHFWGPNIGSGWFARGDVGFSKAREVQHLGTQTVSLDSGTGFGILVGGGYGFALGRETRLLLNLNYSRRQIDSFVANTLGLSVGFLF